MPGIGGGSRGGVKRCLWGMLLMMYVSLSDVFLQD
jgi:hypothetical protein